uniref:Uncharacterized protein n=1 Tax=Triticum urartu TaxID=4572 RepID=A0A8R7V297_TRIUA
MPASVSTSAGITIRQGVDVISTGGRRPTRPMSPLLVLEEQLL